MRRQCKYLFLYGMLGACIGLLVACVALLAHDFDSVTLAFGLGGAFQAVYWRAQIKDARRKDKQKDRWAEWFKYNGPNYRGW